jgi:hypothetical protein
MNTLSMVIDGLVASREWDASTLSRLKVWNDLLGDKDITGITPDEVDESLTLLAQRGKMKPTRGGPCRPSGEPLSPSTFNRYIIQLQSIYRFAKRLRLLPWAFVAPTTGIEKEVESTDPDRYFRAAQAPWQTSP